MDDLQKIGIGLTSFGLLFTSLGIITFFDSGFLIMGNILFLSGLTLTIGPRRTVKFFIKPQNHVGSSCFLGGLTLVLIGWPVVGIFAECYGFLVLFRSFFPTVVTFLKQLPFFRSVFTVPMVKDFLTMFGGARKSLPV
mmetsp:Transcript_10645/g.48911  ORF Transcript_10645/g.48911 Transcript_10645/m.48911 type:complete len:138 (-) Transcript_10645:2209-2622(-)